ncbi:hypothetical protein [Staphylococcus aureus]
MIVRCDGYIDMTIIMVSFFTKDLAGDLERTLGFQTLNIEITVEA